MVFPVNAGLLDFCVLSIVQKEDAYGYSITQELQTQLSLSESTLYPVLRRLQNSNLLTTYDQEFQGRNRRYYRITEEGIEQLIHYRQEWQEHKDMIDRLVEA